MAKGEGYGISYLYAPSGHSELLGELLAKAGIRLGIVLVDVLKDLQLTSGCPFAVLDFVGLIWEECAHVDLAWVHAWGDE